jgi:hypothetical protein
MNRATVGSLILLGVLLPAPPLFAHTALSVDNNALWRVDLDTLSGNVLVELNGPSPFFWCHHLAVSSTGMIRCAIGGSLYSIDRASGEVIELPPPLPIPPPPPGTNSGGLTFDAADRLWYIDQATSVLLHLDPGTGAVLSSRPLSLTGTFSVTLAALGDRLFVFTQDTGRGSRYLEEIDPTTGASLSATEFPQLAPPVDAAFDESGDLWVVEATGEIILGVFCYRVDRIALATSTVEEVSSTCLYYSEPFFYSIAGVRGTVLEIPTLDHVGQLFLLGLLLLSGLLVLRRSGP